MRAARLRLAAGGLALLAGWSATVAADGARWFGRRGPQCPVGSCLGPAGCPGCGLLRSTAAALQGDFGLAFTAHPGGIVVAALLLAGTTLHFHVLRCGRELPAHRTLRRVGRWLFASAVLGGWLGRWLAT
jgi:hypothetical protein